MKTIKTCLALLGCSLALAVSQLSAQTVRINGTDCNPGSSVTFGSNQINVQATGACISVSAPAPTLASLNPTSATPGTSVTATGTNFVNGSTTVTVGGAAATVVSVTSTTVVFNVPAIAAGTPNVVVTANGQQSNAVPLTVTAVTPTITSLAQNNVVPGAIVQVNGTNFATGATATVNGIAAPISGSVSATQLSIVVPAIAPGAYPVVVTVGGTPSTSSSNTLTVVAAAPTISSIAPAGGAPVGSQITINGTGLAPGATATIGAINAPVVGTPAGTSMVVTVPTVATGAQLLAVTVQGVTVNFAITVTSSTPAPTITACTGTVGSTFSITGTNFATGATVTIGGASVTSPVVSGTTGITGNVPASITAAGTPSAVVTVNSVASAGFACTISGISSGGMGFTISADPTQVAIPFPSKVPTSFQAPTPQHAGTNGANGRDNRQNAWLVSASTFCTNAQPAIQRLWAHNLDFTQYRSFGALEYFGLNANEALSYAFVAPPEGTAGNFTFAESTTGDFVGNFMSLTSTPCDFDVTKVQPLGYNACYNSRNGVNSVRYRSTNTPSTVASNECRLVPGQVYYYNYRNQSASNTPYQDSCQATNGGSAPCGGVVQIF